MSRQFPLLGVLVTSLAVVLAGCHPQQPFYFMEDGDLSHYLDVATDIEYPDVEEESLAEVDGAVRPFSLQNRQPRETWDLSLEDAIRHALANSKVIRLIGNATAADSAPDFLLRNPDFAPTVYDPAITESDPRRGTEAALAAFDAQFSTSAFWEKLDTPRNTTFDFIGTQRDLGTFQAQISKTAATGGTWSITHNVLYEQSDSPIRRFPSDWNVNLEAEMRQPLLQGAGVQFNRIAGPGAIPGFNNGVMIARSNIDIQLADFEADVQNMLSDVENAYWDLYLAYRTLDAVVAGRDSGLRSWQEVKALAEAGHELGAAHLEAQARAQYFLFRSAVEQALDRLYLAESNLRYMIGLAATDGRLIRPKDEPNTAKLTFDWHESLGEALCRRPELRRQKWVVKQRELEMITAKNYLLPRLDAVGRYRWLGLGDDMIDSSGGFDDPRIIDSNAYQGMTSGRFQEWQLGLELSVPIGHRKEMAGVRQAQLSLAKERAKLQEFEFEVSHQVADAIRNLEAHLVRTQTNYNRRLAAQDEHDTIEYLKEAGVKGWTLSDVLDAQRRLAEAESEYYRTLVDYNKAIINAHFRKGSLLEYNGVCLSEGPWPGKAYFDAQRRARARDASFYLDYGFTRPKVVSRGPIDQRAGGGPVVVEGEMEEVVPGGEVPEVIPAPIPEPLQPLPDAELNTEPQVGGPAPGTPLAAKKAAKKTDRPLSAKTEKTLTARAGENAPGRWSAVEPAAYQKPIDSPKDENPLRTQTEDTAGKRTAGTWSKAETSDARNESAATPPAATTARTASVWKGVQR